MGLLVEFQPDLIKIDMKLVRGVDSSPARRAVVTGIVGIAGELGLRCSQKASKPRRSSCS
ncbi:hypothetical protein [Arthrobacter sp. CAN_A214]|uniref:hypothetical protein n=1 Tax=Arthrobacter sp. CAN_A214 TaxID=2787720 RepID=UPI003FA4B6FC